MTAPLGYDVVHLDAGAVAVLHTDGAFTTDGPFLVVHEGDPESRPDLIIPAHLLVKVTPCTGACDGGK